MRATPPALGGFRGPRGQGAWHVPLAVYHLPGDHLGQGRRFLGSEWADGAAQRVTGASCGDGATAQPTQGRAARVPPRECGVRAWAPPSRRPRRPPASSRGQQAGRVWATRGQGGQGAPAGPGRSGRKEAAAGAGAAPCACPQEPGGEGRAQGAVDHSRAATHGLATVTQGALGAMRALQYLVPECALVPGSLASGPMAGSSLGQVKRGARVRGEWWGNQCSPNSCPAQKPGECCPARGGPGVLSPHARGPHSRRAIFSSLCAPAKWGPGLPACQG